MGSAGALISWPRVVEPLGARGWLSKDTYEDFTTVPVFLLPKLTRGDFVFSVYAIPKEPGNKGEAWSCQSIHRRPQGGSSWRRGVIWSNGYKYCRLALGEAGYDKAVK